MPLAELIRTRRSVSVFLDKPIPEGLIEDLLETAVWTPNHHLTEPWRFVLLTGDGVKGYAAIRRDMAVEKAKLQNAEKIAQLSESTLKKFGSVPAYLLVAMKQNPDPEVCEEDYAACCCLIQNFMLLAWEQGLGTNWKTLKKDARLRTFFGLGPDEQAVGLVQVGYPAGPDTSNRKSARERLTYISTMGGKRF
jgi:nitroreductase